MSLDIEADNYKLEGSKLTVRENTTITVTCEISETNPRSDVRLTIDGMPIQNQGLKTKPSGEQMNFIYNYSLKVKREFQNKDLVCESKMNNISEDLAKRLNIRTQQSKKFTFDVQCKLI